MDAEIQELISDETHLVLGTNNTQANIALAATHSRSYPTAGKYCKNFNQYTHNFSSCPTIECRYCHELGQIVEKCPKRPAKSKGNFSKPRSGLKTGSSSIAIATAEGDTSLTIRDLEVLLKQVISSNSSTPTALSVTPGNSTWLLDYACCNHMTFDTSMFST